MKNKKINGAAIAIIAMIMMSIICSNNSSAASPKNELPDLVIENLQINPTSPDTGESATISYNLVNKGNANIQWTPEERLDNLYFGDGIGLGRTVICSVNNHPCEEKFILPPGGRFTLIEVVTFPSGGIKKITATANPDNIMLESNMTNNSKSIIFIGKQTKIEIVGGIIFLFASILIIAIWIRKKWKKETGIGVILALLLLGAGFIWLISQQQFVLIPLQPILTDQQKVEQTADQMSAKKEMSAKKDATRSFGSGEYGYQLKFPMNYSIEAQPLGNDSLENISVISEDGQEKFNVKVLISAPEQYIYNGQKSDVSIEGVTYAAYFSSNERRIFIPININGRWYVVSGTSNISLLSPIFLEILATLEFAK